MEETFLRYDVLQELDLGDIGEFSFNFSLNSTNDLIPNPDNNNVPVFQTLKRRMPYLQNFHTPPTNTKLNKNKLYKVSKKIVPIVV